MICTYQQIVLITESVCPWSFYYEKLFTDLLCRKRSFTISNLSNAWLNTGAADNDIALPSTLLKCVMVQAQEWNEPLPLWKQHSSWHSGHGNALREKTFLTENLATLQMGSFNLPIYTMPPKGQKLFLDFRVKRTFFLGFPTSWIIDNFAFLDTAMIFAISSKTLSFW